MADGRNAANDYDQSAKSSYRRAPRESAFVSALVILAWIGSALALGVGLSALLRQRRTIVQWSFLAGMLLLSAEAACTALSYASLTPSRIIDWQERRLMIMAGAPGVWLVFSLVYSRGNYAQFLSRWKPVWLAAVFGLPLLVVAYHDRLIEGAREGTEAYQWYLQLGPAGNILYASYLVLAIAILMNLERTFRASVGTVRWRIKYMTLGLSLIFGVRVYTSSQVLVYSSINLYLTGVTIAGLVLGLALIAVSLVRVGMASDDVYPSQSLLHYSLTGLAAGIYLLVVGFLAKLVNLLGGSSSFPIAAFFVLVAVVGLSIALLSERIRQHVRRFISRHLRRPYYDYRQVWATFTERTAAIDTPDSYHREVIKWICDTFHVLSVNLWLHEESRARFLLGATTAMGHQLGPQAMPVDARAKAFLSEVLRHPNPVRLGASNIAWMKALREYNPQFFPSNDEQVCVPLLVGDNCLGFMTLTDRVNYLPFTDEDLDLLKCVADPIAAGLFRFELSERLVEAKELEAFQVMSAFFVHDLKNTASTLSLMVKNMPKHFDDPEFRQDALRGLTKSVEHINDLIRQLSLIRESLKLDLVPTDITRVTQAALGKVVIPPEIRVVTSWAVLPPIPLDPDQFEKVLINLLNNALEAVEARGEIRVTTSLRSGHPCVTVTDNGCGMSPEFLTRSLFRPFQTTKKRGIGIGMFLSKRIVEDQRGRLEVESELGKGTSFHVIFPQKNNKK